jgi:hypothetical protein
MAAQTLACSARSGALGAVLLVVGCAMPPARPRPPRPSPPPATAPSRAPPSVVEPSDAQLPFAGYRAQIEPSLVGAGSASASAVVLDALQSPPIGHRVVSLTRPGGQVRSVTVGFGRRAQPNAFGSTPPFVELAAESARDGVAIRQTLSALGQLLHDPERPLSIRFRPFEAIRIREPLFGQRLFTLVPNAVHQLADDHVVAVLQVIPMDEAEFIPLEMRGDGAVRAWWLNHRGTSELLRRWDATLADNAATQGGL